MIIGMDFGTTNTGAAQFDGQRVHLLPLDPTSPTPEICRSAIYMTRTGDYYLGSVALSSYFAQNIGRPTRFRKVRVGEIIQIFAELPVFYRDVYIYEDEFSPGRLFTSIKTALRSRDYYGTAFRGNWFSASDLVAIFLMGMKMQMEQQLGAPVRELVLGRPVHFSTDSVEDQIAQSRLLDAAFKAGFERIYLEYEPVAAALAYARELNRHELILVFDFGGGTLDFTIMEAGGRSTKRVLATGGVPIAGDVFDQRLFRVTIPRHLGEGEEYLSGGVRRPIPAHLFDTLSQPAEILSLNTPQNLEMLQQIHAGSLDREKTYALLKVVSANYALMMFDLVERSKRQLSTEYLTNLMVDTPDFSFHEQVSRPTFERAIAHEVETIQAELLATVERAGIPPSRIDRVIRTGGSSQIPLFVELLGDLFGYGKVHAIDIFSSVTSGLAIRAHQIESGQAELAAYTSDSLARSSEHTLAADNPPEHGQVADSQTETNVQPVELGSVLKRLQVRQEAQMEPEHLPEDLIFIINRSGVYAAGLPEDFLQAAEEAPHAKLLGLSSVFDPLPELSLGTQFIHAHIGLYLLMVTNQVKLISAPVRDLYLAGQADPHGIGHSLPLDVDEKVTAAMPWNPAAPTAPSICLITAAGQGRLFGAAMLAETIARRPYFQLERRYTGIPVYLFPTEVESLILIGTNSGRAAYARSSDLAVQPYDMLRVRMEEKVSVAAAFPTGVLAAGNPVGALSADGRWLPFEVQGLPYGGPPAQRGGYLRRGFSIAAFLSAEPGSTARTLGVTSAGSLLGLREITRGDEPPAAPQRVVRLTPGEDIVGYIAI